MKNIIVKFGFQLRKNNNKRDMRVVILIITLIYVIIAIRKIVSCREIMSLISVNNLTFGYDGSYNNICEDVSFNIDTFYDQNSGRNI